ncbi:MAG: GDSL-type esterase/lipase family protein [Planctomycetota bacterium]
MANPLPSDEPRRVACIGGSITFGLGLANRRRDCYPAMLERRLGEGFRVRNFGYSGAAVGAATTLPYRDTPSFEAARRFRPNIVVMMLGANDAQVANKHATPNFENEFAALGEEIRAWPTRHLLVVLPTPLFPPLADFSAATLDDVIRPTIQRVAGQRGWPVVDAFTPLQPKCEWFPDGVHPAEEGAAEIARVITPALLAELAERP